MSGSSKGVRSRELGMEMTLALVMPSPAGTVLQALSIAGTPRGWWCPSAAPDRMRGWARARNHPRGPGAKGDGSGDKVMKWSQEIHLGDRATSRYRGQASVFVWGVHPEDKLWQCGAEVHPGGRARGRAGDLLWCSWGRGSCPQAELNLGPWVVVGVLSEASQGH